MKKYLGTILVTILLCLGFGYYFFNTGREDIKIYGLMEGNYASLEDANEKALSLPSSLVLKEDNEYVVYTAMYEDMNLINKMLGIYQEKNINITLKEINCSRNFLDELNKYESVAKNLNDVSLYNEVNQNILDLYAGSL